MSRTKNALRALRRSLLASALFGGFASSAGAQTLEEALARAYAANPTLESERAELLATNQLVPQALAGYRPQVRASSSYGFAHSDTEFGEGIPSQETDLNPAEIELSISQPLYRGGRTQAAVRRAEALVQAQRGAVIATEQQVLLEAVTAYVDVVRDQAVLELNLGNEAVLRRQLEAALDRFEVGEITRTDVSQAEARLERAVADRIQSEGQLQAARAAYVRVVGEPPGELEPPALDFVLPASLDETIELATANNPRVVAAQFAQEAATEFAEQVRGEGLPEASLVGSASRSWESRVERDQTDSLSVIAQVSVPLYQGGAVEARLREARQTANQRLIEVDAARREVVETAVRAWEALVTARAAIEARQAQVRAAEVALEGVEQEATLGARTVLDVLDAEQELLDARVSLVRAQRDEVVAAFQVLAATGQLTARQLQLPVEYYDFEVPYLEARDVWWGGLGR